MCGRYALYGPRKRSRIETEYFSSVDAFPPRWNVAPTDTMPICRLRDGVPELAAARWGLVTPNAQDSKGGAKKINAPAEQTMRWADYRVPYRAKRRCLVPATGFYEWERVPDGKQPFLFISPEHTLLAFAGLWEAWRQPDGGVLLSYTIMTTAPNDFVKRFHDRMPVVLDEADCGRWLTEDDPRDVLRACHNEALINYPVSRRVNSVKNDDATLVNALT
ncbi:MAG TPA: SOS response-associated peptidase [Burkholderiales bacterium]|nr:SOS response-associated peptidase [Burkholderiales bacterium]